MLCPTALCQNTVCTPSRASFLTGRYPAANRCIANGQGLDAAEITLPERLGAAGWATTVVGKLHIQPCHPDQCPDTEPGLLQRYQRAHWSHHPFPDHDGNAYTAWLAASGGRFATRPHPRCPHVRIGMPVALHQTTWCVDRTLESIAEAEARRQPWLVSLNCFDPHHDFDPPESHLARYGDLLDRLPLPIPGLIVPATTWEAADRLGAYGGRSMPGALPAQQHRWVRAAYWAMVDLIDEQLGRLFGTLRAMGAWDRTIVVVTSDHGELLGDHGLYLKGPHFYEGAVRVPLILRAPGLAPQTMADPVELVDLAPTLYDLAGTDPHPGIQGRSLLPRLRGGIATHRDSACSTFYDSNFTYPSRPWSSMVRTARHKLVRHHASGGGQLFDLGEDPDEVHDLWFEPGAAALRGDLCALLADRLAEAVDIRPGSGSPW